ncbi:MAG: SDR family oxidoreductase, partial [Mycobacteriales bacterium]
MTLLRDRLAGTHVLLTGATGFVGEALLARLLTDLPDTRVSVLVRTAGAASAEQRVAELLTRPAFAAAPAPGPGRLTVLAGDLADLPALPAADVVIHCAGEVSFDPPLDEAVDVNVHGV